MAIDQVSADDLDLAMQLSNQTLTFPDLMAAFRLFYGRSFSAGDQLPDLIGQPVQNALEYFVNSPEFLQRPQNNHIVLLAASKILQKQNNSSS
jgi:hypothetical protein